MSLKDPNIEELFRSGLEEMELPVNDTMWNNISNATNAATSSAASSTTATSATKILTYLGLSGAACAIGVAATVYFTDTNTNSQNENITNTTSETQTVLTQDENTITHPSETISEDEVIVEQIILQEEPINDPVIVTTESEQEPIKVVAVTEEENQHYKGSWINDYLTPKESPYTEPESTSTTNLESTTEKHEELSQSTVKPTIEEVKEDEIIASIVAMPVGGYAPLEVTFAHHTEKGNVSWDFGDGSTSLDHNTTHTFEKFGKYTVTLTLTDSKGNKFQDYRVIDVLANSAFTNIPNVFTPNNDGSNDYYKIEAKNIESFSMVIINQEFETLFQTEDLQDSWDGSNLYGEAVPNGNYIVIISAIGIDGKKYEHKEVVKIVR